MTRIIVEKLIDKYPGGIGTETVTFNISDQELLRLGKKYFELASNPINTSIYVAEQPELGDETTISQSHAVDEIHCDSDAPCEFDTPCSDLAQRDAELLRMAKTIKIFCSSRDGCDGCPFSTEGPCKIFETPNEWKV